MKESEEFENLRIWEFGDLGFFGKYFGILNSFSVQASFPADFRRFFRRFSQIFF
jgi:hypothetical protein